MQVRTGVVLALVLGIAGSAMAGKKELKRVEKFPAGEQTNVLIGSFLSGIADWHKEEFTFGEPFGRVWDAAKEVAYALNNEGGRPVSGVDAVAGRIHVGKVSEAQFFGMGPGTWVDEISIELKRESDRVTTVKVLRKVVEKEVTNRKMRTQKSNGKVERYILSRIDDVLSGKVDASDVAAAGGIGGRYVSGRDSSDYLLLRADGTCLAQQAGLSLPCRYESDGAVARLTYQMGMRETMRADGETLIDSAGTSWSRGGKAAPGGAAQRLALTNEDISRMAAAKLPDSVILSRMKDSETRFDLSTDALIKLKAAGVSDAVLEAMTQKH